jgi:hypothetical protein
MRWNNFGQHNMAKYDTGPLLLKLKLYQPLDNARPLQQPMQFPPLTFAQADSIFAHSETQLE